MKKSRAAASPPPADDTNPKDRLGALKVPLRLNPGVALIWMALVFELGAWKYGEYNWRNKKVRITVYSEAIDRHNLALRAGEDIDDESGLPHTAHIMACAAIIEDARACDSLIDDRFEKDMSAYVLNAMVANNYHKKMMSQTRTPARTLDEVRGSPKQFAEFMSSVIDGVKERRISRTPDRQADKDAKSLNDCLNVTHLRVGKKIRPVQAEVRFNKRGKII